MSTVTTQIPARMDRLPWSRLALPDGARPRHAAVVELLVGVSAEGESLEDIAEPLSATGS